MFTAWHAHTETRAAERLGAVLGIDLYLSGLATSRTTHGSRIGLRLETDCLCDWSLSTTTCVQRQDQDDPYASSNEAPLTSHWADAVGQ